MRGDRTSTTIWVVRLQPHGDLGWRRASRFLDPTDRARSTSLHDEEDRRRLAVSRLALRELVRSLRPTSSPFVIEHPRHRAPHLPGGDLQLSLAHSGHWVLGVASPRPVGVDVEASPPVTPSPALVLRHLSPGERAALGKLSSPQKARAFLRLWVRKEAALKAAHPRVDIDPRLVDVRSPSVLLPDTTDRMGLTDLDLGSRSPRRRGQPSGTGLEGRVPERGVTVLAVVPWPSRAGLPRPMRTMRRNRLRRAPPRLRSPPSSGDRAARPPPPWWPPD